jgi:hypothetical protein
VPTAKLERIFKLPAPEGKTSNRPRETSESPVLPVLPYSSRHRQEANVALSYGHTRVQVTLSAIGKDISQIEILLRSDGFDRELEFRVGQVPPSACMQRSTMSLCMPLCLPFDSALPTIPLRPMLLSIKIPPASEAGSALSECRPSGRSEIHPGSFKLYRVAFACSSMFTLAIQDQRQTCFLSSSSTDKRRFLNKYRLDKEQSKTGTGTSRITSAMATA